MTEQSARVVFGVPGSAIFDMEFQGGPVPPGVHPPNKLDATVVINCTEEQARAMEVWLRAHEDKSPDYKAAANLIRLTLQERERR